MRGSFILFNSIFFKNSRSTPVYFSSPRRRNCRRRPLTFSLPPEKSPSLSQGTAGEFIITIPPENRDWHRSWKSRLKSQLKSRSKSQRCSERRIARAGTRRRLVAMDSRDHLQRQYCRVSTSRSVRRCRKLAGIATKIARKLRPSFLVSVGTGSPASLLWFLRRPPDSLSPPAKAFWLWVLGVDF